MAARELFEAELRQRGIESVVPMIDGRVQVALSGQVLLVSLDNLRRRLEADPDDVTVLETFVDAVVAAAERPAVTPQELYWCLEANDLRGPAAAREPVSRRLDRVLAWVPADRSVIGWVTDDGLASAGLSVDAATLLGWANLDRELAPTRLHTELVDGVPVGIMTSEFPSKASLLWAPGLRGLAEPLLGWPLLAVAPDRDFVYLWNATRTDLVARMADVVTREHRSAPYPLSTEVFEIGSAVRAIGEYSKS